MNTHTSRKHYDKKASAPTPSDRNHKPHATRFTDNRPEGIAQRKMQKIADNRIRTDSKAASVLNGTVQRMRAYDESEPLKDPRHFSTTDLKAAIDECVEHKTPIPGYLQEQVAAYLRNELSERHDDMERHGGGDAGHLHYFEVVQDYVDLVESLVEDEKTVIPTGGPALQLKEDKESNDK